MAALVTFVEPTSQAFSTVDFDVISEEAYTLGSTVTSHPVERGVPIADHVQTNLIQLVITGVASNTPLTKTTDGVLPGLLHGSMTPTQVNATGSKMVLPWTGTPAAVPPFRILGIQLPAVPPTVEPATYRTDVASYGGSYLQFPEKIDRARRIFTTLERLCNQAIPLKIVTDVRTYGNMLITDIVCRLDGTTSLAFRMTLNEFRIANTDMTFVQRSPPKKPKPKKVNGTPPEDTGKKVDAWDLPINQSLAATGKDWFR